MGQMGFDAIALQKYPEVGAVNHVHHAGNSSGIVDGAAVVLIASEQAVKEQGLKPRAKVLATALVGADPTIMLTGPAPAARKALAKAGLTIDDIDLFEVNEAFAAVVMRFMNEMKVDPAEGECQRRCNCHGTSTRCDWCDDFRDFTGRVGTPRQKTWSGYTLRRWRYGHRNHY